MLLESVFSAKSVTLRTRKHQNQLITLPHIFFVHEDCYSVIVVVVIVVVIIVVVIIVVVVMGLKAKETSWGFVLD